MDRDRVPEIPPAFDVHSYPSLLVLGAGRENILRIVGYARPAEMIAQLEEGRRRHALYLEGKEWAPVAERTASLSDAGTAEAFRAPTEESPRGMEIVGDDLWILQGETLFRTSLATGERRGEWTMADLYPGEILINDLATDGERLYLLPYGWTAGDPILVVDPAGPVVERRIVTESNRGTGAHAAYGMTWLDGRLWILERGSLHAVDPATGLVERTVRLASPEAGGALATADREIASAGDGGICLLDPATGRTRGRIPANYGLRAIAYRDGDYYVMEQPVYDHDREHRRIRVWPRETLVYRLTPDRTCRPPGP